MDSMMSVSIIIFSDEDILFIKQCRNKQVAKLLLPRGKLLGGESLEECSKRIIDESAGIGIELDKNLGGIITRKNNMGDYLVTFIMLGEACSREIKSNAEFIRFGDIENCRSISQFSRFIINKLSNTSLAGMKKSKFAVDGREYITYF